MLKNQYQVVEQIESHLAFNSARIGFPAEMKMTTCEAYENKVRAKMAAVV